MERPSTVAASDWLSEVLLIQEVKTIYSEEPLVHFIPCVMF